MPLHYPAAEAEAIIQEVWQMAEDSLAVAKQATEEAAQLRADKVILEKVASERPAEKPFTPQQIDQTLGVLEDLAIITPDTREKLAASLVAEPTGMLKLLEKVAQLSLPAPDSGEGVGKTASRKATPTQDEDPDGWGEIVRLGAA